MENKPSPASGKKNKKNYNLKQKSPSTTTNSERDSHASENNNIHSSTNLNDTLTKHKPNSKSSLDDKNSRDISHMDNKILSSHANNRNNNTGSLESNVNKTPEENCFNTTDPDNSILGQNANNASNDNLRKNEISVTNLLNNNGDDQISQCKNDDNKNVSDNCNGNKTIKRASSRQDFSDTSLLNTIEQKVNGNGSDNGYSNRNDDDKDISRDSKNTTDQNVSNIARSSNSHNALKEKSMLTLGHKNGGYINESNKRSSSSDAIDDNKSGAPVTFEYTELNEIDITDKETIAELGSDYNYPPKFQSTTLGGNQEDCIYINRRSTNEDLCFASKEYMKIPSTYFQESSPPTSKSELFQPALSPTMYNKKNNDATVCYERKNLPVQYNESCLSHTTASTLSIPSHTVIYFKKDNNDHSLSSNSNHQAKLCDSNISYTQFCVAFPETENPTCSNKFAFLNKSNNTRDDYTQNYILQTCKQDVPVYNVRNCDNNINMSKWNSTLEANECNRTGGGGGGGGGGGTTTPTEQSQNTREQNAEYKSHNEMMRSRMALGSKSHHQNLNFCDADSEMLSEQQPQQQRQQQNTNEDECPSTSGTQTVNDEDTIRECLCKLCTSSLNRTTDQQSQQEHHQLDEHDRSKNFCICRTQNCTEQHEHQRSQCVTELKQCISCGGNLKNHNDVKFGDQQQPCNHSHDSCSESRHSTLCGPCSRKQEKNACDCMNNSLTPSEHCKCATSIRSCHHSTSNLTKGTQTAFFTDRYTNTETIPPCPSKRVTCHCTDDIQQQKKVNCLNEENLRRSSLSRHDNERIIKCPPATVKINQPQVSPTSPAPPTQPPPSPPPSPPPLPPPSYKPRTIRKSISAETTMNEKLGSQRLSRDMTQNYRKMDEKSVQVNILAPIESTQPTPTIRYSDPPQKFVESEQHSRQSLLQRRRSEVILDHEREKMATNRSDHPRLKSFLVPQTSHEEKVQGGVEERTQEVNHTPIFLDNTSRTRCSCTQPVQDDMCESTDDDDDKRLKRYSLQRLSLQHLKKQFCKKFRRNSN